MRPIVWIATLASCGRIGFDGPDRAPLAGLPDGVSAGSRLHLQHLVDETGAASFETFIDTQLDTRCTFQLAADGVTRCLPIAGSSDFFGDAACTRPIASASGLPGDCEPARFVTDGDRFHEVGPPLPMGYLRQGTSCLAVASPFLWFELGPEVPLEAFVAASTVEVPASARFSYEQLDAEDGARMLTGRLVDHELGTTCRPEPAYLGLVDPRCAPAETFSMAYLDAACTQRVFLTTEPVADGTVFGSYGESINNLPCRRLTYHRARGAQSVATLFVFDHSRTDGCVPYVATPPASASWVVQADELARDDFGEGGYALAAGRVTHPIWEATDGVVLPGNTELFDRPLSSLCVPTWTADGQRRCMPLPLGSGWALLDATCSMAPVNVYGTCGDAAPYGLQVAAPDAQTCGNYRYTVLEAGPLVPLFGRPDPTHACTDLGRMGSMATGAPLAPTAMSAMTPVR